MSARCSLMSESEQSAEMPGAVIGNAWRSQREWVSWWEYFLLHYLALNILPKHCMLLRSGYQYQHLLDMRCTLIIEWNAFIFPY